MRMKNDFHSNGFALGVVLKQRLGQFGIGLLDPARSQALSPLRHLMLSRVKTSPFQAHGHRR